MRWYLERGDEFICMEFSGADVEIVDHTGAKDSLHFDTPNQAYSAMRERCKPLFSAGYESSTHPDQRFKPDAEIQKWWLEAFEKEVLSLKNGPKIDSRGMLESLEKDHHQTFSPDLRRFLAFRDTHSFGWSNYNEWRIWDEDLDPPDFGVSNRFERLILMDQNNYLGTAMAEAFFGGVFIGTAGNGDSYYATPGTDPNRSEVVLWDHETASIENVIADSVSSFAYLNHVLGMVEDEDVDDAHLEAAIARIAPRVNPSWHYSSIFDDSEITPEYSSDNRADYMYWRLIWVNYLLRQDGVRDMSSMRDLFAEQIHTPLNFEEALQYPYVRNTPVTQFYWLWRLFWFAQHDDLKQMIGIAKGAPSPLVRDCATLIEEFENGRTTIGKIKDIHALRQEFLALDLDPARAEDRLREAMENEKRATLELAAQLDEAHDVIATGNDALIVEAAFASIQKPEILDVLYEHLEQSHPDIRAGRKLLAFLEAGGASRENRYYEFETTEIKECLGRMGDNLLPLLIQRKLWEEVGMSKHPRAFEFLAPQLHTQEKYHHSLTAAAKGLAAGQFTEHTPEILAKLRPLILELRWESGDYLSAISKKDGLRALIEAVGVYGQSEDDLAELQTVIDEGPTETLVPALKAASAICARIGQEPEFLYAALSTLVAKGEARAAYYCYATLGTQRALRVVKEVLEIQSGDAVSLVFERIMLNLLNTKHGGKVNQDLVQFASGIIEKKTFEDGELHLAVLELLEHIQDADFVRPHLWNYANHDDRAVRLRALARLEEMGGTPMFAHRVLVDEVASSEGITGLTNLLLDPTVIWKHNVLRKAVEIGVSPDFAAATAKILPQICYFTHYTGGYVSDYHDNLYYAIEAAHAMKDAAVDRVLGELLSRPNTMYAKPLNDADVQRLKALVPKAEAPKSSLQVTVQVLGDARWLPGGNINGLAVSGDQKQVWAATNEGLVEFDAEGRVTRRAARGWLYDVQRRGNVLAVSGHSRFFALMDATTLETLHLPDGQYGGIRKSRFSPDSLRIATVSDHQSWTVVDVASGALLASGKDGQDINGVDWIDDQTFVVCTDTSVVIHTVQGEELARTRCGAAAEVRVAPSGEIFVGTPKGIRRYDKSLNPLGEPLKQLNVSRMEFRSGKLVAASWDGKDCGVWIWDVDKAKRKRAKGHDDAGVFGMCLTADGKILAGGNQKTVVRWDAKDKLIPNEIPGHTDEIAYIGEGRGNAVLTVSDDRKVLEWNVEQNAVVASFGPFDFRTCAAKWAPDGSTLYVCGTDTVVALAPDNSEVWRSNEVKRSEYLEVFEDTIVAASGSSLVWLNRHTGALLKRTEPFADSFIYRWVRLDHNTVLCAGYDDTQIFVIDLGAKEISRTLSMGGKERMRSFNRLDSNRVIYTRWDNTLTILNVSTGKPERVVKQSLGELAADPETGRIFAWSGVNMTVIEPDGKVHEPVTTLAAECVQVVHGTLVLGTKSGAVAVILSE